MRPPPSPLPARLSGALLSLLLAAPPAFSAGGTARVNTGRGGVNSGGQAGAAGGVQASPGSVPGVTLVPALNGTLSPLSAPALSPASSLGLAPSALAETSLAPQGAAASPARSLSAASEGTGPSASLPAARSADSAPLAPYAQTLVGAGAPLELVRRLDAFLASHHPGDQDAVYHGLQHSRDVAAVAARMAAQERLDRGRTVLVVLAASLHDLDPERAPGAPPVVAATVRYLQENAQARELVAEFAALFGFTPGQVRSLILATDFNPVPEKLAEIKAAFERSTSEEFSGDAVSWARQWGLRLSVADKSAAYLGDQRQSLAFVRGLAGEFRAAAAARGAQGPTDAQIVADTHKFMGSLNESPEMNMLPYDLRERYDATLTYFRSIGTPEAAADALRALDDAPKRGPPAQDSALSRDVASARRYIAGIAGGMKLQERQRAALFEQWLEDEGLPADSARAQAVKQALLPASAAADAAALEGVSPALSRHHASLLKLAREQGTTPAEISATLVSAGLAGTLASVDAATFEHQSWLAMRRASLERAVRRYPDNQQGDFMRQLASAMSSPGGKSVEEVARDGVFAYVDFTGSAVSRVSVGRDPDPRSPHMVFYVTRREEKWRIDGYRQNRELRRSDAELTRQLKAWLQRGGIPAADFE